MKIQRLLPQDPLWKQTVEFAKTCSWEAGPHLTYMLENNLLTDWEAAFAAVDEEGIAGFCTFMKTDYYPENRYSPWVSSIFVEERARGHRLSGAMIDFVCGYAKEQGFTRVYIPSDHVGLYEKYGFTPIDTLVNYGGDTDTVFARDI